VTPTVFEMAVETPPAYFMVAAFWLFPLQVAPQSPGFQL
jgi:hypothetical protein